MHVALTNFAFDSPRLRDLVEPDHRSVPNIVQDVWQDLWTWCPERSFRVIIQSCHATLTYSRISRPSYFSFVECGELLFDAFTAHLHFGGKSGRMNSGEIAIGLPPLSARASIPMMVPVGVSQVFQSTGVGATMCGMRS